MMAKLKLICLHKSINENKAAIQLTMEYFYHINYEYTLGNSVTLTRSIVYNLDCKESDLAAAFYSLMFSVDMAGQVRACW